MQGHSGGQELLVPKVKRSPFKDALSNGDGHSGAF